MGEKDDSFVEDLLARYRPATPDDAFRERVLAAALAPPVAAATRPPIVELAAGLLISACLQWSAADRATRTVNRLDGITNTTAIEAASIDPDASRDPAAWWQSAPEPMFPESES